VRKSGRVVGQPGTRRCGGGTNGVLPDPSLDGGEGWEEAVHMPTSVTHVTEEHFLLGQRGFCILGIGPRGGDYRGDWR